MVATVRKNRKQSTTQKKNSSKKPTNNKKTMLFVGLAITILLALSASFILLHTMKQKTKSATPSTKPFITATKQDNNKGTTYHYDDYLKNKQIDSGSGIKEYRSREAEKLAEEKKRKEQQQKLEKEKKAKLEKEKKLQEQQNQQSNKIDYFIRCTDHQFKQLANAEQQKANLAFTGKESTIMLKKEGNGYIYFLSIGPYSSLDIAKQKRNEIIKQKLGNNCSIYK